MCERWYSFENFLADMGYRQQGETLDRIDVDKGYMPSNCRWADASYQNHNKTNVKGYSWNDQKQKWQAQIKRKGKNMIIGFFDTREEAQKAYLEKAKELYPAQRPET